MTTAEIFNWVPVPFDISLYASISEAKMGKWNLQQINKEISQNPISKNPTTKSFCERRIQHNNECIELLNTQIEYLRKKRGFNNS